jgi:hypothetical protein
MSAFIVDKNHILYMVQAAMRLGHGHSQLRWFWSGPDGFLPDMQDSLAVSDYTKAADVANMLWRENIASVSCRYPNESSNTLPGPKKQDFVITPDDFHMGLWSEYTPVRVLKACDCFEYQSCEHDGWKWSEALAFINALRNRAIECLPGYDEADWGAPKTDTERRKELREKQVKAES